MSAPDWTLARRAVACKHWKWLGGTSVVCPPAHDGATGYTFRVESDGYVAKAGDYPDLTDPATLGCLLALVREAWEPYGTFVSTHRYDGGEWSIRTLPIPMFATEAEALVAALEGAL